MPPKNKKYCQWCNRGGHVEDECFNKIQYEYYVAYCRICEESGHLEEKCPLLEQAARLQIDDTNTSKKKVARKSSNKKVTNNGDFKDSESSDYTDQSKHSEMKLQYNYNGKYEYTDDSRRYTNEYSLHAKVVQKQSNSDTAQNHKSKNKQLRSSNLCKYCNQSDHDESHCYNKTVYKYYNSYCHYCEDHGHFEDTCRLIAQAASEQIDYTSTHTKKNGRKHSNKKVTYADDFKDSEASGYTDQSKHDEIKLQYNYNGKYQYTEESQQYKNDYTSHEKTAQKQSNNAITQNYKSKNRSSRKSKLCSHCNESDHDENDCYTQLMYKHYSSYCHYCEDHGHFEDKCPLVEQAAREQMEYANRSRKRGSKKSNAKNTQ